MPSKTVVVTGANKGIGRAIVKQLATKSTQEWKGSESVTIYLTARNPGLGTKALKEIEEEVKGQKPDNYKLKFETLDITSEDSISKFGDLIKKEHQELDILINNAGMATDSKAFKNEIVKNNLNTNYYGTLNMMKEFLPLMKKDGRIINVSSQLGELHYVNEELQKKLLNPKLTISQLSDILEGFANTVKDNVFQENDHPKPAYGVSKMGTTGLSKVFAHEQQSKNENDEPILIRACHPGYVNTDMTSGKGHLTVEEGAETPVYLALAPKDSIIGASTRSEFEKGLGIYWSDKAVKQW